MRGDIGGQTRDCRGYRRVRFEVRGSHERSVFEVQFAILRESRSQTVALTGLAFLRMGDWSRSPDFDPCDRRFVLRGRSGAARAAVARLEVAHVAPN